jgi:hypothetical protein
VSGGKMGQGGGREFVVDKIGRVGMIGQGGGRERGVDEIGEGVAMIGHGGGRIGVVVITGVYLPLLYRFRFRPGYSLGRGGGRDRMVGYGVLLTCVGLRASCASPCASRLCSNAVT